MALGVVLELVLIIANVGTAVVPYAVFKRYSEGLALGYVAARLVEAIFIGHGIISLLAFLLMRQEGTAGMTPLSARLLSRSMAASSRPEDFAFASVVPKTGEVFQYLRMCT